jgi:hypothetical protein
MATTLHSASANAELHETLGTDSADAGQYYQLYDWAEVDARFRTMSYMASRAINTTIPSAITLTAPTSYTTLSFTAAQMQAAENNGTLDLAAGPKITYTGADAVIATIAYSVTFHHTDASSRLVNACVMKNGTAQSNYITGADLTQTQSFTLSDVVMLTLAQNDYVTIAMKVPAGNLVVANAFIRVITKGTGA